MKTNTSAVLYHYDEESGTEIIQRFTDAAVSGVTKISESDGNRKNISNYVLRIPTRTKLTISCGDKVYVSAADKTYTVLGYSDNRRGSLRMWHWRLHLR